MTEQWKRFLATYKDMRAKQKVFVQARRDDPGKNEFLIDARQAEAECDRQARALRAAPDTVEQTTPTD